MPRLPEIAGSSQIPVGWRHGLLATLGLGLGSSAAWGGLYDVSSWGPAAVAVLAAALAVMVLSPAMIAPPARLLLSALTGLAAFAGLSMLWAQSPPAAAIEAHRWALYAATFLLVVKLVRDERSRHVVLGSLVAGALVVDVVLVAQLLGPDAPSRFFNNRLTFPLGYVNGQAAVLAAAVWPAVAIAEQARQIALRGAAAGTAAVLIGLMLLTQSRAGLASLGVTAVLLVILFPGRARRMWLLLVIGASVALVGGELAHVYSQAPPGRFEPEAEVVNRAVAHLLLAGFAAAAAWSIVSALLRRPALATPAARRAGAAVLVVAMLAAGGAIVATGDPAQRLRSQVDQFTQLDRSSENSPSRLLSGGGNRYDYWRVAVAEFRAHPVAGLGAGNYVAEYYARRRSSEVVRQPHSLQLQQLAELGVPGLIAVGGLLVAIGWLLVAAARRVSRGEDRLTVGSAVAAGGVLIAWTVHTSVDWLHLLPGLTGGALCAAACLASSCDSQPSDRPAWRRVLVVAGCGAAICLAGAGVGRLTLAAGDRERAREALTDGDPRRAMELAERSLDLQPQELGAFYTQAAAWARLGDYSRARNVLLRAAALEPRNPVPRALLGDLAVRRGDLAVARREYAAAVRLDPRDPVLRAALRRVGTRRAGGRGGLASPAP
ncbi:MAG TPA: O-antigen ligase family protein [Solirubrobacteraceae bacterium]|nr:O-antigen ligase family protein [Solirubrobacteraceae bacterium]